MGMISEFKEFAVKGNMIDMAVGIIIGGAFGTIVSSLVADVIMPPIGLAMGGVDFSNLALALGNNPQGEPVLLKYGVFVNHCISFLIVAFAVFMLVKGINTLRKQEAQAPAAPAPPTTSEKLLEEIRDSLQSSR